MERIDRSLVGFALLAGLALGVVLGLVWTMVLRERGIRRLYLEYEAFRASALIAETFRQNPALLPLDDRILGFGIYAGDGQALLRSGSAPERLAFSETAPAFAPTRIGPHSLILQRLLGPDSAGMPGMRFMMHGRNPGEPPPYPPAGRGELPFGGALGAFASGPRALWLEYSTGDYARQAFALLAGAALATLALLGFFILLVRLYRKNAQLRETEIQSRELVQLGEAARTLVHEIKNPLSVIRVQAATLRRLGEGEAAQKARAKALLIDDEVERLAGLADRIREFLKGGEGEAKEIELGDWLRDFALRHSEEVRPPEGSDGSAWVRADPERLSLAMDNLLRNALEATQKAALSDPQAMPALSLVKRGRQWEILVSDRGPGVPADDAARVFEPFYTTKEKGTGIGLALARRVARAAGGDLVLRPRAGGGSVFAVILPALHAR